MTETPRIVMTWMGRDVDELSRDELVEALRTVWKLYRGAVEKRWELEGEQMAKLFRECE